MQVNPFLYNIRMVYPVMTRKPRKRVRRRTELPGLSVESRAMSTTAWSAQPPWGGPVSPGCGSHQLLGKHYGSLRVSLLLRGQILCPSALRAALGRGQCWEQAGDMRCAGQWDGQCCPILAVPSALCKVG